MDAKKSNGISIGARRAIAYIVLILLSFLCLFWFYILFINATRSNGELGRGFTAIPSTHLFENLTNVFHGTLPMVKGMRNSLIISSFTALCCTLIPTQVTALGFVQLVNKMGLENNFIPLIIPSIASPVTFFYMKQYMEANLPTSLLDAARIDGAGEFFIFNKIVLPLMKPAIAVQAIFSFVSSWNNYFTPALILHKEHVKTLPILIAQLRAADWLKFDMGQVYAAIAFSIFPVIVVYLLLSKYIVGGVAAGAVKG